MYTRYRLQLLRVACRCVARAHAILYLRLRASLRLPSNFNYGDASVRSVLTFYTCRFINHRTNPSFKGLATIRISILRKILLRDSLDESIRRF